MKEFSILCDFDGTITIEDTGVVALDNFSQGDWRHYDRLLEQDKISLEGCIITQFEMLKGKKKEILELLQKKITIRCNIMEFLEFCKLNEIPFIILSAGLDFVIEYFISKIAKSMEIPVYSPKTHYIHEKLNISFPNKIFNDSKNFKEDIVRKYMENSETIIYIGNGLSDFEAVRVADYSYVVKNTKLAKMCAREKIPFEEFEDFNEIITSITKKYSQLIF
ncbi:MAG: HAD-IB family phosphatase [Candidatus Lokiarchaeota archaeon]|nr:HAD-IB family phosphatase [Candidatus Lokiarchaeota archaeon]MBD3202096.1 HAD-IB family phosphatase [Candidatus Lokiarchaeota archaeon]